MGLIYSTLHVGVDENAEMKSREREIGIELEERKIDR